MKILLFFQIELLIKVNDSILNDPCFIYNHSTVFKRSVIFSIPMHYHIEDFDKLCDLYAKHMKKGLRDAVFMEIDSNRDGMVTLRDIQRLVKFNI